MTLRPHVTVGVASYNAGPLIDDALASVLAQDYAGPLDVIVLDDASEDDTVDRATEVLAGSGVAHRIIAMDENQVSRGRSPLFTLATLATGSYLARLDADDYWLAPDKLSRQVRLLEEHPDIPLCGTGFALVGDLARAHERHPVPHVRAHAPRVPSELLTVGNFVAHSSVLVRVDEVLSLAETGGWQQLGAGDYAAWGFISAGRDIGLIPEAITAYRVHPGNAWAGRGLAARLRDELDALLWLAKFSPSLESRPAWKARAAEIIEDLIEDGPGVRASRAQAADLARRLVASDDRLRTAKNEQGLLRTLLHTARWQRDDARRERDEAVRARQAYAEQLEMVTTSRGYRLLERLRSLR